MAKQASYKELFDFKWPPDMPSFSFRRRKKYSHTVVVIAAGDDPTNGVVLTFPSESKAEAYKTTSLTAVPQPIVEYIKKEIPVINKDGIEM